MVGGVRCGTGWLSQCLRDHPAVFMATDETRFFDRRFDMGLDWWIEEYFSSARDYEVRGEKTAAYLNCLKAPERISRSLPNVKLICSIRNPVDRLFSDRMLLLRGSPGLANLTLEQLLNSQRDLVERGLFTKHLARFFELIPEEQIHIVFYESLVADTIQTVQSVYRFLGVGDQFVPQSIGLQTKPGSIENKNRISAFAARILLHKYSPLKRKYSSLRKRYTPKTWSEQERSLLKEIYAEENEKIFKLFGIDYR
ncbi:sulfotransferase family protein [Parahaliea maris]|uniref:sulfotransferase family protein n=1 Tax=Parahaliea maris TaxID=2716870 RepID=UPI0022A73FB9|nr:sulfotransferase [Parahaliea maris]